MVLTLFGATATILFHAFLNARLLEVTEDVPPSKRPVITSIESASVQPPLATCTSSNSSSRRRGSRTSWIGPSLLARVALLYVSARLFSALSTVYLPLYIEELGVAGRQALATVPLTAYASAFVASLLLKYINRCCGTKVRFMGSMGCKSDYRSIVLRSVGHRL